MLGFRAQIVTLIGTVGYFAYSADAQSQPVVKAYEYGTYQELADKLIHDNAAPGMVLSVYQSGKAETVVSGVRRAGTDDKVTRGDLWLTASIGKPMTSTLIAMLIDEGRLDWGTTLKEALPGISMRPDYEQVTVRDLLQHRGRVQPYTDLGSSPQLSAKTPTEMREEFVSKLLQEEPLERPQYSNGGYGALALIAEKATGMEFKALMQEYVFDRLGMTTARIAPTGSTGQFGSKGQPFMHRRSDNGFVPVEIDSPMTMYHALQGAGAGIAMSIEDFVKFGRFHLDGMQGRARLISQETFDEIHRAPEGKSYANGWGIHRLGNLEWQAHNGGNGMMHAELHVIPSLDMVIASVANAGRTKPGDDAPYRAVMSIVEKEKD